MPRGWQMLARRKTLREQTRRMQSTLRHWRRESYERLQLQQNWKERVHNWKLRRPVVHRGLLRHFGILWRNLREGRANQKTSAQANARRLQEFIKIATETDRKLKLRASLVEGVRQLLLKLIRVRTLTYPTRNT